MAPGTHHNEKDLLRKVARGDEKAFRVLYDLYRDRIYGTSIRLLHSGVLAEDVVQEVFMRLWLQREMLTEVDYFSTYLTGIARHCSYAAFNKLARQGRAATELEVALIPDNSTDDLIVGKSFQDILQEAVRRLSPQQAQVYRLSKDEGYKREEIAAIMNISPETVKSYLAQATRTIRAYCKANMEVSLFLLLSSHFLHN